LKSLMAWLILQIRFISTSFRLTHFQGTINIINLLILLFTVYQLPVFGVVPRIDCDKPS
jgi:hypothetical protein